MGPGILSSTWAGSGGRIIGRCPSTVRPVFPVLVFQLSEQQNHTRTASSTVLGTSPNSTRTKKFPLWELRGGCFASWVFNWESTENCHFHRLEPYTKPYSDTSWDQLLAEPFGRRPRWKKQLSIFWPFLCKTAVQRHCFWTSLPSVVAHP